MLTKNKLKDLIYIQENKLCREQTIKSLFRALVEPVLENNTESLILVRLEDSSKKDFNSILRRLEYSNAKIYDFSDNVISEKFENILKEKIWGKTEFIYILAERYSSALIFDYEDNGAKNLAEYYIMQNSKLLSTVFEIISENSSKNLSKYADKWHPDRRDNELLNLSVRKIVENLSDNDEEIILSEAEVGEEESREEVIQRLEFLLAKSSHIAHEMRNMLSIANLYSSIIEKQEDKIVFQDEKTQKSILNARNCIRKSMQMTGNLLLDFKSLRNTTLKEISLNDLLETAIELSQVYATGKNIKFNNIASKGIKILADENKFLTVLINLIKNAVESIEESGDIVIKSEEETDVVKVIISNSGKPIDEKLQLRIFEEGFTTKSAGSGLGLVICKKTLEEQYAGLALRKSDETGTEFEITVLKGG